MAKQPFEPSNFPAGERHLDVAKHHVESLEDAYGVHLADHVTSQLHHLHQHLDDALNATTPEVRLAAISAAQERVEKLEADNALNLTLTEGVHRLVGRQLDRATLAVEDADS